MIFAKPRACNLLFAYTLWFNVLFYALLARFLRAGPSVAERRRRWAQWLGAALHVLPFWVVSQYIVQCIGITRLCGRPAWTGMVSDAVLHWVPLVVTLGVLRAHSSEDTLVDVRPPLSVVLGVVGGLMALYLGVSRLAWGGIFPIYHVPFGTLVGLYLPPLLLAWILFGADPFLRPARAGGVGAARVCHRGR